MNEKIKLKQILWFLRQCEPADKIQVVFDDQEWEDFTEVRADSKLLDAFQDYIVKDLAAEFQVENDNIPVFRVSIKEEGA